MNEKNYTIYQADPESTVGLAISSAIEMAKKEDKNVLVCLRDTTCVVTKRTKLSDGIEKYRMTVERFSHSKS